MHKLAVLTAALVTLLTVVVSASATPGSNNSTPSHRNVVSVQAKGVKLCVGSGHGCFTTLQAAVDAAHDGDTVTVAPGTFAGGITINTSIRLVGSGADATIIEGGGPVLTIGVPDAPSEPTVTIDGVTVTGGVTVGNLSPSNGRGGGIYVPRAAGPSTGATVTIRNSVIRDNSVAPASATDSGIPCPGGSDCRFAGAGGGGISNDGTMTLDHTVVSNNRADAASGLTSDAIGGGILNRAFGNLTLKHSTVTDNHANVTAPNGRFAEGGGIAMVGGTLEIDDSVISNNTVDVSTSFPSDVETWANSGGIHSQASVSATIRNTTISGNTATAGNLLGDAIASCGGLCVDGSLALRDSTISDNVVRATTASATGNALVDAGALGLGCCWEEPTTVTVTNTRFTGNSVSSTARGGLAFAAGGAIDMANRPPPSFRDSVISSNRANATSTTGSALILGVGITNFGGSLELRNTRVSDNSGTASAPDGAVEGGGIWNGGFDSTPELILFDSVIARNTLSAGPGIERRGGGLFTTAPVVLKNSLIAENSPDQCYGC